MASVVTKEQLFSSALLSYMADLKGGRLKKFCEVMTQEGGESITFNRVKEGTAKDGLVSMYDSGFTGDMGDMIQITVPIAQVSAQDKIKEADMNKTKLDVKNAYVKGLGNAVDVKCDEKVIGAITTVDSDLYSKGVNTALIDAQVKILVSLIRRAKAYATNTVDNYTGIALIINPEDWAQLSTSELVLNSDYEKAFGGGMNGEPETFYGAEVIISKKVATGTTYVVPSNTICFAEWENSNIADAVFVPTDMRRYHVQAVKSVGVKVAEAGMIGKLVSKPLA
ncbi:MAG: phage capsid protein [Paraclostridium sp.]